MIPHAEGLGPSNPSVLSLSFVTLGAMGLDDAAALKGAMLAWAVFAAFVLGAGAPVLRAAWNARDPRRWALLAALMFVLLQPRPMAYGYLLLVPAPLLLAPGAFSGVRGQLLLAVALSAQGFATLTHHGSSETLVVYAPFLLTLFTWLLVVQEAAAPRSPARAVGATNALAPAAPAA